MKLDRNSIVEKLNFGILGSLVEMKMMMDNQVEMVENQFVMGNQLEMGKQSFVVLVELRMVVGLGSLANLVVDWHIVVDLENLVELAYLIVDLALEL